MRHIKSLLELVLDHPPAKSDGRFGNDQNLVMTELVEVVFHLCRKGVSPNAKTSAEGERVQRKPELRIDLSTVDNRGQLAVDLDGEHVLILESVLVVGQQLGIYP